MILYWPHCPRFCSQLDHCSAPASTLPSTLYVHWTQLHPSKLAGFARCKTCPFLWNYEVKWTESLCMLHVESNGWRAWMQGLANMCEQELSGCCAKAPINCSSLTALCAMNEVKMQCHMCAVLCAVQEKYKLHLVPFNLIHSRNLNQQNPSILKSKG